MSTDAPNIETLAVRFVSQPGPANQIDLLYIPIGNGRQLNSLFDQILIMNGQCCGMEGDVSGDVIADLISKMNTLRGLIGAAAPTEKIILDGQLIETRAIPGIIQSPVDGKTFKLGWIFGEGNSAGDPRMEPVEKFGIAAEKLLANIQTSIQHISWIHLRKKLGAVKPAKKLRIFISYRRMGRGSEFAESVGNYLGNKGFYPWYDQWDVLPGDSLPQKISKGLDDSTAAVLVVTSEYQNGKWATEEMNAAIAKCIEAGFPVVALLFDHVELPALLAHRVWVDFSDHEPSKFEERMSSVLDGVLRLPKNPFARGR